MSSLNVIQYNPDNKGALTWSTNFQHFSAYHSDLGRNSIEVPYMMSSNGKPLRPASNFQITVQNTKTNKKIVFEYFRTDYEGQGDDREVAGWRYKAISGHSKYCELLLIND